MLSIKSFFIMLFTFINFNCLGITINKPVVVLHGIASSADKMNIFSQWLEKEFDRKVYNIEIGNGYQNSLFMPLNKQLVLLCKTIYNINELKNGFDFIGMSQGGMLARGYVEQCNKYPVSILINLVSPNGGVIQKIPSIINMYSHFYQEHFAASGYWRDPENIEVYLKKCSYLPQFNNEIITEMSQKYKENIKRLQQYIVIWSPFDEIINPPESAKFSIFDSDYNIIPLYETGLYINDTLGIKSLNDRKKFHIYETNCTHTQHRDPSCFGQLYEIFKNYL